ncbi:MAG: hypothetical protein RMJ54_17225, partial [Roseiflexaceae bacterium]|nr:hypothetical protein [Roseiflexaceae bacterium]
TMLSQVLESLKHLEPHELLQVSQVVQERLASHEEIGKRQMFYHSLLAAGLVKKIKTSSREDVSRQPFVQTQGEPVSQTIIEERR